MKVTWIVQPGICLENFMFHRFVKKMLRVSRFLDSGIKMSVSGP